MTTETRMLRSFAHYILTNATEYQGWLVQGLGMLRLSMSNGLRLHVWDESLKVPNVTAIHTHSWGFMSLILAGSVTNNIYKFEDGPAGTVNLEEFDAVRIMCGPNASVKDAPHVPVFLKLQPPQVYLPGRSYRMSPDDMHSTDAMDGTVTLIQKDHTAEDHAYVFIPKGREFVSAAHRPATKEEVQRVCGNAVKKWFWEEGVFRG